MKSSKPVSQNPQILPSQPQPITINGKMAQHEEWYTTEDVMKHLKVSRSNVYRLRNRGEIICIKLGRTVLYPKHLINKMMLLKVVQQMPTTP